MILVFHTSIISCYLSVLYLFLLPSVLNLKCLLRLDIFDPQKACEVIIWQKQLIVPFYSQSVGDFNVQKVQQATVLSNFEALFFLFKATQPQRCICVICYHNGFFVSRFREQHVPFSYIIIKMPGSFFFLPLHHMIYKGWRCIWNGLGLWRGKVQSLTTNSQSVWH